MIEDRDCDTGCVPFEHGSVPVKNHLNICKCLPSPGDVLIRGNVGKSIAKCNKNCLNDSKKML